MGLGTSARIGIRTYASDHPIKSALLIYCDHRTRILEEAKRILSPLTSLSEMRNALSNLARRCRKEGLTTLANCLLSIAEHYEDLGHVVSERRWPADINEMLTDVQRHIEVCFKAACEIKD